MATALLGIGGASFAISTLVSFEETMARLQGVTRATTDQMEAFEETARTLGATTRFSATEAGEGLLFLARAGLSTEEAIATLPATLDLATAGTIELGRAADIASNVMSAFGLEAEDTEQIVDTLVNTANRANTDIEGLAEAMKLVAPVAGALGRSVEETAAAIGALGDAGIQGSMAGTSLRQIMNSLINPTNDARRVIEAMGLTLEELDPTTNSLADIFQRLRDANLDAAQAAQIFSTRAGGAALVLADSAEKVRELSAANLASAGTARANAAVLDDTLGGALKSLRSAIEELLLQTGDGGLIGDLKGIVSAVTDAIRVLAGMQDQVTGNEQTARRLAAAFKIIAIVLAAIVSIKIVAAVTAMTVSMASATASAVSLAAALWPVWLALGAIAAAAVGFEAGRFIAEEFRIVQEAGAVLANDLLRAWLRVEQTFEATPLILRGVWNSIRLGMLELTQFIVVQAIEIGRAFEGIVRTATIAINKLIVNAAAALEAAGFEERAQEVLASRLSAPSFTRGADELLRGFDLLREGIISEREKIDRELDALNKVTEDRLDDLDEILLKDLKEIQLEFGASDTRGLDPIQFALEDLRESAGAASEAVQEMLTEFAQSDTAQNALADLDKLIDQITDSVLDLGTSDDLTLEIDVVPNTDQLDSVKPEVEKKLAEAQRSIEQATTDGAGGANEAIDSLQQNAAQLIDSLGTGLAQAFEDAIFGAKSLQDSFKEVTKEVIRLTLRLAIAQALSAATSAFTGGGGAIGSQHGNVFSRGNIVPFQSGGVLTSSTFFPMSEGRTGLAGEAGPEAIIPLQRDARGRLGVMAQGMEGGNEVNTTNVTINVQTQDAASFKQSQSQITSGIAAGMQSAQVRRTRRA